MAQAPPEAGLCACRDPGPERRRNARAGTSAKALVDPEREAETRTILRKWIATQRSGGLKALLSSAPLEGIDLERLRDFGRDAAP